MRTGLKAHQAAGRRWDRMRTQGMAKVACQICRRWFFTETGETKCPCCRKSVA